MKLIATTQVNTLENGINSYETAQQLANDANPIEMDLAGVSRIDLHFPKFTDGRAFTQAMMLRKRLGFKGEIRATGEVLVDQLQQMQRSGFDVAVLREDQDIEAAQRQLQRFGAYYQADALHATPAKQHKPQNAKTRYAQTTDSYAEKLKQAQATLRQAASEHDGSITQAHSLGAEDVVIAHLIRSLKLDIPAFVLDTGKLNTETLELLNRIKETQGNHLTVYQPQHEAVVHFVAKAGELPMYKGISERKACCHVRKMEPLARALVGKTAWVTGLRREQSSARADVPLVDDAEQQSQGRVKFNPLANWTWGEIWYYIDLHQLDYNRLHDQFFPSIGCAPCTRAISMGEDFRAGRWWWEANLEGGAAKECGLHVAQQKA